MTLTSWIRSLFAASKTPHTAPRASRPRPRPKTRLLLEALEERTVPSWVGAGDGAYIVEPWASSGYRAVQIQPADQKIVAAGYGSAEIARYSAATGNPDPTFGSGGYAAGPSGAAANGLVLQGDSKAVVAGTLSGQLAVTRFTAAGTLDGTYGTKGSTSVAIAGANLSAALAAAVQSSGKVVVVGDEYPSAGYQSSVVARFTTSGALDSGTGGFGQISKGKSTTGYTISTFGATSSYLDAVAVQSNDEIVAAGSVTNDGNHYGLLVARYTAAGVLDATFNVTGYNALFPTGISNVSARAVALQADGKIVVAGNSSGIDNAGDVFVARFNANGTLDTTFGGSGFVRFDIDGTATQTVEQGQGLVIQPDGKLVVAGNESLNGSGSSSALVVRFNPDGTPDTTFAPGGFKLVSLPAGNNAEGNAVALQSNGTVIVAGIDFWGTTGDTAHPLLMKFLPSSPQIGSFTANPNPVTAGTSTTLTASNITDGNAGTTVTQVAFYICINGSPMLLGYGTQTSPGAWTYSFDTTGYTSDTYTLFAQAEDSYGIFGNLLPLTLTVS